MRLEPQSMYLTASAAFAVAAWIEYGTAAGMATLGAAAAVLCVILSIRGFE